MGVGEPIPYFTTVSVKTFYVETVSVLHVLIFEYFRYVIEVREKIMIYYTFELL